MANIGSFVYAVFSPYLQPPGSLPKGQIVNGIVQATVALPWQTYVFYGVMFVSAMLWVTGGTLVWMRSKPPVQTSFRVIGKTPWAGEPEDKYKLKVWVEIRNESDTCPEIRVSRWEPNPLTKVDMRVLKETLQIRLGGSWLPIGGTDRVHIAKGEAFKLWVSPDDSHTLGEINQWCSAGGMNVLGSLFLFVDGVEQEIKL